MQERESQGSDDDSGPEEFHIFYEAEDTHVVQERKAVEEELLNWPRSRLL